jgi:hypothetical protein
MIFTFEGAFSSEGKQSSPKVSSVSSYREPMIMEGNLEDELGMLDYGFERLGVDEICHVE